MAFPTWSAGSGNWTNAADWSTGAVPGDDDDASIAGTNALTVTVSSGSNTVDTLSTGASDTLALTGGTLSILGAGNLAGPVLQSAAASVLVVGGAGTTVSGSFSQTAGTVVVQAGTLALLAASSSLGGTVSGAGMLSLGDGGGGAATTIEAGAVLTVAHMMLQSGTLALAGGMSYGGNFMQFGELALNGHTGKLSGLATLSGTIGGSADSGTLALAGAETLDGASIGGADRLNISRTTTLRDATTVLGSTAGSTAMIDVLAAGTLAIADDHGIAAAGATSTLMVAGTLLKSGYTGESVIGACLSSAGGGTITVAEGTLGLQGAQSVIGGLVGGAGTLALDGVTSSTTLAAGTTLAVGTMLLSYASVTLATSLTYAGTWVEMAGSLVLHGKTTLALTGEAELMGGKVSGAGSITASSALLGNGFELDLGAQLSLSGYSVQTGYIALGVLPGAAPGLQVLAGASYLLESGAQISGGPGAGRFTVAGSLLALGQQTDTIEVNSTLTGSVTVLAGELDFAAATVNMLGGTITGAGLLQMDGTARLCVGTSLTVAQLGVGGTLNLLGNATYAGTLAMSASAAAASIVVQSGKKFTLSGTDYFSGTLSGGGVVATTGAVGVAGGASGFSFAIDGATTLSVAGTADQSGNTYLGVSAGSAAVLDVLAHGTWTDHGSAIGTLGGTGTLDNAGTFAFDGGADYAQITANVVNSGVVQVLSGDLDIAGSGGGNYQIGDGATLEVTGAAFGQSAGITFVGASSLLEVDGGGTFNLGLAAFNSGDEIDLTGFNVGGAAALSLAGGVLTVASGADQAHIAVGAGATLAGFTQQNDGYGAIALFHT